jgi:hypothetical protein
MMTKDTLKEIFSGQKKLLKLKNVDFIQVPKYDELSVKNLYDKLVALDRMQVYFPRKYSKGRQCDRDYLFNVANTIHPQVMSELVAYAQSQRFAVSGED